jgi:rhamnogalacturonan II specific xylosyltransferase
LAIANTLVSFYFLSRWDEELNTNPQLNQPLFNTLLQSDNNHPIQIRHAGLDEVMFPPGRLFFNDENKSKVLRESVVVHNNYIIGRENKKRRFEEYGLWKT